mgnify:CR=1 FL=1
MAGDEQFSIGPQARDIDFYVGFIGASSFSFIDTIFNGTFRFTSVNYWIFLLFGFAILAISILTLLKITKKTEE